MFFKKKYISFILIFYCSHLQSVSINDINKHNCTCEVIPNTNHNVHYSQNKHNNSIYIESNNIEIFYPNKIKFSGNVLIHHDDSTIKSNQLVIDRYFINNKAEFIVHSESNVLYHNKILTLTGSCARFNLNNNNIDLHQGTYYIHTPNIHGTAREIMQRKNNRYTIIKQGKFTSCISKNNSWNITGSEIIYDNFYKNIYIWNACFKIDKIPLFYSPYLLLSMHNNNNLESYLPKIQYNNNNGLSIKLPFPLFFSKYSSGSISPHYISKIGFGLNTKINYHITPTSKGFLNYDLMQYNIYCNECDYKNHHQIHWKHNGCFNNKWHFKSNYIIKNNLNNDSTYFNEGITKISNDYINQEILFYFNNKNIKVSAAHLKFLNTNATFFVPQPNCTYSADPQIEIHLFYNFKRKDLINFQIFNQISRFTPSNLNYPESIRIHIEPSINYTLYNNQIRYNIETKLNMTHYQQNNISNYNTNYNFNKLYLIHKVNRIVPQFKINGKIFLKKKTNNIKQKKYFLESKLQYLYIPYVLQDHIGIYDTKSIYLDNNNLFYGLQYSGLDRITDSNQITGNIIFHCLNKHKKRKFYSSIGQILHLTQKKNNTTCNDCNQFAYNLTIPNKNKLYFFNTTQWNINNHWNIHSETQYNAFIKKLSISNTTLKYTNKNNIIFQTNYRYVNTKRFHNNFINSNRFIYHQTISQLGCIIHYPLMNHWTIGSSYYYNFNTKSFIDQFIGIQYRATCWIFDIVFERNITHWNNKSNNAIYENKIRFHFNLLNTQSKNVQSKIHKFLDSKLISYHYISDDI